MKIDQYDASQFAEANRLLLPPGEAWQWPLGGFGDEVLQAHNQEFARMHAQIQSVIDYASTIHQPAQASWHLDEYRRVAYEAVLAKIDNLPRRYAAIGSHIGDRLWSSAGVDGDFNIPLIEVDHLIGPARVGSRIGDALWGTRSRYILRVRYFRSVANPKAIWDALLAFKQAHVFLWFEDITGVGGNVNYAQD